jgi:hypothetical protein
MDWYCLNSQSWGTEWLQNWGVTLRSSSRIVKSAKNSYRCLLGCTINVGEPYARLELEVGGYVTIGLCRDHLKQYAGNNYQGWLDTEDLDSFLRKLALKD